MECLPEFKWQTKRDELENKTTLEPEMWKDNSTNIFMIIIMIIYIPSKKW